MKSGLVGLLEEEEGRRSSLSLVIPGRETFQEAEPWSPGPLSQQRPALRPFSQLPPHPGSAPPPPCPIAPAPPLSPRGSKGGWPAEATVTPPLGAAGRAGLRKLALEFGQGTNCREVIWGRWTGSERDGSLARESAGERNREERLAGRALGGAGDCGTAEAGSRDSAAKVKPASRALPGVTWGWGPAQGVQVPSGAPPAGRATPSVSG